MILGSADLKKSQVQNLNGVKISISELTYMVKVKNSKREIDGVTKQPKCIIRVVGREEFAQDEHNFNAVVVNVEFSMFTC